MSEAGLNLAMASATRGILTCVVRRLVVSWDVGVAIAQRGTSGVVSGPRHCRGI